MKKKRIADLKAERNLLRKLLFAAMQLNNALAKAADAAKAADEPKPKEAKH
jgi:hypothetical protein